MQTENNLDTVTDDDIDAGFKNVEFETRGGRVSKVCLKPVPACRVQSLMKEMLDSGNDMLPLLDSLPPGLEPDWLDKLNLESLAKLKSIAFALSFGNSFQKKIQEAAKILERQTRTRSGAASSPASAPASANGACADGATPS